MVSYCSILKNFYVKDYLKIIWYLNQLFWAFICSTQIFLNSHKSAKNISLTCRVLQTQENKLRRGFGMSERIEARVQGRSGSYENVGLDHWNLISVTNIFHLCEIASDNNIHVTKIQNPIFKSPTSPCNQHHSRPWTLYLFIKEEYLKSWYGLISHISSSWAISEPLLCQSVSHVTLLTFGFCRFW